MKTAYLAIQCTDKTTGTTGTFLFTDDMVAISPVLPGCVELFAWAKENGWKEGPRDSAHPVGVYVKEDAPYIATSEATIDRLLGYLRPYVSPDDAEAFNLKEFAAVIADRVAEDVS
jgi:hypothetical protein